MVVVNVKFAKFQAGLVGIQILWTKEAEIAIKRARIDRIIMKLTNQRFLELLNSLIDLTSKDLSKMIRTHYETMVTIHVHQRLDNFHLKQRFSTCWAHLIREV